MRAFLLLPLLLIVAPVSGTARPVHRDASGVRSFIEQIYAGYPRHSPRSDAEYYGMFDPGFAALIRDNDHYGPDLVGPLDFDPICQCQDDSGFSHRIVSLAAANDKAQVLVRNSFGPPAPPSALDVRYSLVRIDGRWRIADIGTSEMPSMRAWLKAELAKPR